MDFIQVIITADKKGKAEQIVKDLLESRLAACGQIIGPVSSHYWWKGKIETSEEWLCLIKSKKSLFDNLEKAVRETHTYEIPEIIALPILAGSSDYLKWIEKELIDKKRSSDDNGKNTVTDIDF